MTNHFVEAPKKVPSPAAQAILDAFSKDEGGVYLEDDPERLSFALRAVADQVVPEEPLYGGDQRWEWERDARQSSRKKMLAIADELEAQ